MEKFNEGIFLETLSRSFAYLLSEDHSDKDIADAQVEGVQIVEDLLRQWADSEDPVIEGGIDAGMAPEQEEALEVLKQLVQSFAPRIQSNVWVKSLLTTP